MNRLATLTAFAALSTPLAADRSTDEVPTANPGALQENGFKPLFDGKSLSGWRKVGGTGQFKTEDESIVGFGKNIRGNTFLRTEKLYGDFCLVFQYRFDDLSGNSGCQIRSSQKNGNGRVFGYQCELDNNRKRAFTAGIYDEARRGWLYPGKLSKVGTEDSFTAQGKKTIKWDDWNTVVVRCEGTRIRTWLNGVRRADFDDTDEKHATAEGFIALQVHGGRSGHVRWRRLFIKEL